MLEWFKDRCETATVAIGWCIWSMVAGGIAGLFVGAAIVVARWVVR